jgi:hypothetical protein
MMDTLLSDLNLMVRSRICLEGDGEAIRLERLDFEERQRCAVDDTEREQIAHAWLRVYVPHGNQFGKVARR